MTTLVATPSVSAQTDVATIIQKSVIHRTDLDPKGTYEVTNVLGIPCERLIAINRHTPEPL